MGEEETGVEQHEDFEQYWKVVRHTGVEAPRNMNAGESLERLRRAIEEYHVIVGSCLKPFSLNFELSPLRDRMGFACAAVKGSSTRYSTPPAAPERKPK